MPWRSRAAAKAQKSTTQTGLGKQQSVKMKRLKLRICMGHLDKELSRQLGRAHNSEHQRNVDDAWQPTQSPPSLFASNLTGLCNHFAQIGVERLSNSQQSIQARAAQVPFHKTDDGVRKTRTLSKQVHGQPTLPAFFSQQLDQVRGNGFSQARF
jgi:hypothetical protein